MKIIYLFLGFIVTTVCSQSVNETKILDFVTDLIDDWNSKHKFGYERDVAIINLDNDTIFYNELLRRTLQYNPTLLPSQEICSTDEEAYNETVPASLMIFVSNRIDHVSFILKIFFK